MELSHAFRDEAVARAVRRVAIGRHHPGPDGVRREHLLAWWDRHGEDILERVLAGTYRPGCVWGQDSVRLEGLVPFSENLHARVVSRLLLPLLYDAVKLRPEVVGFRRGFNQHYIVRGAKRLRDSSRHIASVTLEPFVEFDLPHSAIKKMLTPHLSSAVVDLIGLFLARPVHRHGAFDRGLRRGLTISGALVNIAMHYLLDPFAVHLGRPWLRYQTSLHIGFSAPDEAERTPPLQMGEFLQVKWEVQDAAEWLQHAPALLHFESELLYRQPSKALAPGRSLTSCGER